MSLLTHKVRSSIVLYTKLPPDVVDDLLRQEIEAEAPRLFRFIWFVTVPVLLAAWITGPRWNDPSRQVVRKIDGQTFRLERRHRTPFSAAFYGSWQAEVTGTSIGGYFGLPPSVLISVRVWLAFVVFMGSLGIVLNLLDLTVGTHFTIDPRFGLILSSAILLVPLGIYKLAIWLGSRRDLGSIAFIEQKLMAFVPEVTELRRQV